MSAYSSVPSRIRAGTSRSTVRFSEPGRRRSATTMGTVPPVSVLRPGYRPPSYAHSRALNTTRRRETGYDGEARNAAEHLGILRSLGGRVPGPICHEKFGRRRPEQESGLSAELLRTRPNTSACLGVSAAAFLGQS